MCRFPTVLMIDKNNPPRKLEGMLEAMLFPVICYTVTYHYCTLIFSKATKYSIFKLAIFVLYVLFLLEESCRTSLFKWVETSAFSIKSILDLYKIYVYFIFIFVSLNSSSPSMMTTLCWQTIVKVSFYSLFCKKTSPSFLLFLPLFHIVSCISMYLNSSQLHTDKLNYTQNYGQVFTGTLYWKQYLLISTGTYFPSMA